MAVFRLRSWDELFAACTLEGRVSVCGTGVKYDQGRGKVVRGQARGNGGAEVVRMVEKKNVSSLFWSFPLYQVTMLAFLVVDCFVFIALSAMTSRSMPLMRAVSR